MRRFAASILLSLLALTTSVAVAKADDHAGHDEGTAHAAEHGAGVAHDEGHGGHVLPPVNWADFGYGHKDVYGGKLHEADTPSDEPMAPPFVLALVNFAIFAGILIKFVGPKLAGYLQTRHDAVKTELVEAARLRKDAESKLSEYQKRMDNVQGEVDALIREIRSDAEAEKKRILADAEAQAALLKKEAESRIASEIAKARVELEREVVAHAVSAAERILREKTNSNDQQALFDNFVAGIGSKPPTGSPTPATGNDVSKGWS
jgi:F-type H+-transporting ATPase subunit b